MRKLLPLFAICLIGCQSEEVAPNVADPASITKTPPSEAATKGRDGVAPMSSGATGALTPMSGTQDLGSGTGGGIAQAAKDRARGAASQAGGGSAAQSSETGE